MSPIEISRYAPEWQARIRALTATAWAPAMAGMHQDYPGFVWRAFYPDGWEARLDTDITAFLARTDATVSIAHRGADLLGFVGLLLHPEDRMGEVHVLAVAPAAQRTGLARRLMERAETQIAEAGMEMVMVETGGDGGHAPARAFYEATGYVQAPVARYFKQL